VAHLERTIKRKAVYAGSFDPLTNGHLWVIEYGAKLFDELIVAIGDNPDKKYTFSLEERLEMLKKSIGLKEEFPEGEKPYCKITIDNFNNQFLIDYAKQKDAKFILRGIRNSQDYSFESSMAYVNSSDEFGGGDIETVWAPCPKHLTELSSSFVKVICGPKNWQNKVSKMVPYPVYEKILQKYS